MKKILTVCFTLALAITPVFALDEQTQTTDVQVQPIEVQAQQSQQILGEQVQTIGVQDNNNSIKIFSIFKRDKNVTPQVITTEEAQEAAKSPIKIDASAVEREMIMEYQQSQVNSMVP